MGSHLFNLLGLKEGITRIPFNDDYFSESSSMDEFVSQCDVIVHLAALNRHPEPEVLYKTNIDLISKLISSMVLTKSTPHVIFSS